MDQTKRNELIDRMGETTPYNCGVSPNIIPLVTVERYFDGADGMAGLLCNSSADLDNDQIHAGLNDIADRADVHALWVALSNCDDDWPFSDKLVLVTTASARGVSSPGRGG